MDNDEAIQELRELFEALEITGGDLRTWPGSLKRSRIIEAMNVMELCVEDAWKYHDLQT